jgi:hypothetical protein
MLVFDHRGALCVDVAKDATSLRPYADALVAEADGRDVPKVMLLPRKEMRARFLAELPDLGAFYVGERKEMLLALERGEEMADRYRRYRGATLVRRG